MEEEKNTTHTKITTVVQEVQADVRAVVKPDVKLERLIVHEHNTPINHPVQDYKNQLENNPSYPANKSKIRVYSYNDISNIIDNTYLDTPTNNSNIIDIIDMYVKGQKILYTEAKTICEMRLSYLMLPSILFTVLSSIISLILTDPYGKIISSTLNGSIAFILSLINYLKLDARAEAHRVSAYKYDKLESYISFQSGKQLFFEEAKQDMGEIVTKIEHDIKEIKETNPFVLPEIIRVKFPLLTNINVFAEVKKINNDEMILKTELMYISNSLSNYKHKVDPVTNLINQDMVDKLTAEEREKIKEIIFLQRKYFDLDLNIKAELVEYTKKMSKGYFNVCAWLKV